MRYIPELDTHEIVDVEAARRHVHKAAAPGTVVDTHVVDLPPDPELVIVLRKAPDVLYRELSSRGWPQRKVIDNVWAEILDVVYTEARGRWGRVYQIDVTRRDPQDTFELIRRCVLGECPNDEVDWLTYSEETGFLQFIERESAKFYPPSAPTRT